MNKQLVSVAAVAAAATAMAVESQNVVGFTSSEAEQGKFIIVGAQFEHIAEGGNDMKINGLVSGMEGVDYDDDYLWIPTASQIQVPNNSGSYDVYRYLNDGWYDDGTDEGGFKAGWCDIGGNITDDELTPGVSQWAKSVPSDGAAQIAGAVSDDSVASIVCPQGFALRANVFPKAIPLNGDGMTSANIVGVDYDEGYVWLGTAPQIQVPNASGSYDVYRYLNDGWYDDGTDEGGYKAGWCDIGGNIVDNAIAAAQGFWTKGTTGQFTLSFSK